MVGLITTQQPIKSLYSLNHSVAPTDSCSTMQLYFVAGGDVTPVASWRVPDVAAPSPTNCLGTSTHCRVQTQQENQTRHTEYKKATIH